MSVLFVALALSCTAAEAGTETTGATACVPDPPPEKGTWERCSAAGECDDISSCSRDSSLLGGSGVSVCTPQCKTDADCPPSGEFAAVCDGDGACTLPCAGMADCPQGMVCAYYRMATQCAWPTGAAAWCSP